MLLDSLLGEKALSLSRLVGVWKRKVCFGFGFVSRGWDEKGWEAITSRKEIVAWN